MSNLIPEDGISSKQLDQELDALRLTDCDQTLDHWKERCFLFTFHASDEVYNASKKAYAKFISTDALSDVAFPSVGKLRRDLADFTCELLRGPDSSSGTITTGGTESIILAMTAARNWAREKKQIVQPEVILAETAHPAFYKAAQLLDVPVTVISVDENFCVPVDNVANAITGATCFIVGSAPTYWHGVHDDIPALGQLALDNDLWLHVDGCMGSIIGSFARLAGFHVPEFDFSVPGVRSISADFHKYGFSMKGASILAMRDEADADYHTFDLGGYAEYVTPGLPGTRGGGAIASAWSVFRLMGKEGFKEIARDAMQARKALLEATADIDGLILNGQPALTLLTFRSDDFDMTTVGAELQRRGWVPNVYHNPDCLHLRLTPAHKAVIPEFASDLADAADFARKGGRAKIRTGAYATR
jgi:sphinganine-1-phosphate aldolase